jgi:hypothetical protein
MALGVTITKRVNFHKADGFKFAVVEFTGDGSYAAGGYVFAASTLGWNGITSVFFDGVMGADGAAGTGLSPRWDATNGKIKLYKGAGAAALTEAAAGDPSALKCRAWVVGF